PDRRSLVKQTSRHSPETDGGDTGNSGGKESDREETDPRTSLEGNEGRDDPGSGVG
ncbi:Hypothetical predicted protein, partial [Marmota monax]